jgi:formate C-acetyltransferase
MYNRNQQKYERFAQEMAGNPIHPDNFSRYFGDWQGHATIDYETLLNNGFPYIFFTALDGFDNAGRIDRNLMPFYAQSLIQGEITRDEAVRLMAQVFDIWSKQDLWNVAIAGQAMDGESAANELTAIVLEARRHVKHPKPGLSFSLNTSTPARFIDSAIDTLAVGLGHPAFYNDNLYVKTLIEMGYPPEDAVRYAFGGCSETHIPGYGAIRDSFFNLATAVECVL